MDNRMNENTPDQERPATSQQAPWQRADSTSAESMASRAKSQVNEAAQTAKETVVETGRKAAERIEQGRESAARGLGNAATVLHEKADNLPGVQKVSRMTHVVADRMESCAEYLRGHDLAAMARDAESSIRRNPGMSLALAVVAGFLISRMVRSNGSA